MGIAFGSAINRRTLLKASLVAGGAVVVRPLVAGAQPPAFDTHATASSSEWRRTAVTAARSTEGPPAPRSTPPIFAPWICRDGRRTLPTRCC
jgi:hypothetical protein